MSNTNTLIKWPGGKAREIKYIKHLIPTYDRYIEPFFGGGAVFFYLKPQSAIINDISTDLIDFYTLTKEQNVEFKENLLHYCSLLEDILKACDELYDEILKIYNSIKGNSSFCCENALYALVDKICNHIGTVTAEALILNIRLEELVSFL